MFEHDAEGAVQPKEFSPPILTGIQNVITGGNPAKGEGADFQNWKVGKGFRQNHKREK